MFSLSALNSGATGFIGDGIVILILVISLIVGIKKGFLGLVVGFLAGIVTIVLCTLLCDPLAQAIGGAGLTATLDQSFSNLIKFEDEIFTTPLKSLSQEQIANALSSLELPEFLNSAIADLLQAKLADTSIAADVSVKSVIISALTNATLTAIAWCALFVVLSVVFALLKRFVKIFNKIPLIGFVNKLLGGLLGLILAAIMICVIMYLFTLLSSFVPQTAVDYVQSSPVLGWIYNHNPLGQLITAIFTK